jgi:HTH-type transcriptional regulator, glycine betaine synthesis regulator
MLIFMAVDLLEKPVRPAVIVPAPAHLTPLETEVIDLFVQFARLLSLPKSVAEIYGLLFVATQPLAMDDLIERLKLSKGSASQGLRFLRNLGGVKTVYVAGDRRDHYQAETELRHLVSGFLKELAPHFDRGLGRLNRIEMLIKQMPADERARITGRLDKLKQWQKHGRQLLPFVVKFLGK